VNNSQVVFGSFYKSPEKTPPFLNPPFHNYITFICKKEAFGLLGLFGLLSLLG
jgi:hypothetical protein